MIRIYDAITRNRVVRTNLGDVPLQSMHEATPIDIQEVHNWWHSQPPGATYDIRSLGPCVPPFPKVFMEYRPGGEKAEDELPPVAGFYPVREGISIVTRRFDGGWYLRMQVFVMHANGTVYSEPEGLVVSVGSDGTATGSGLAPTGNLTDDVVKLYDEMSARGLGIDPAAYIEHRRKVTREVCFEAAIACIFANCKNIELEEEPPRHTTKAVRRRHGDPVRYRVIRLPYTGRRRPDGRAEVDDGGAIPLHMVRGHFKTYTKDRPLFGRITGTYWWAHHLRGEEGAGVVHHEYEVGPS